MRAVLLRSLGAILVPFALLCLFFPFAYLVWPNGPMLIDDTRGFFGAGTAEGVPLVRQATCMQQRYGGNKGTSRRGIPTIIEYECELMLGEDLPDRTEDPYAGLSYEDAMKAYSERIRALDRRAEAVPDRITRTLARDVSRQPPPHLRLLSEAGESPPRYAVIFGAGELVWRWAHWFFVALMMWAFGAACLFATRACFRRARGETPF